MWRCAQTLRVWKLNLLELCALRRIESRCNQGPDALVAVMIAYINGGRARLRSGDRIVAFRKVDSVVAPASKICHVSDAHDPDSTPIFGIATRKDFDGHLFKSWSIAARSR
jgi:hypothetical protein